MMLIREIHVLETFRDHAVNNFFQSAVQIHEFFILTLYICFYFVYGNNRLYWTPAPPKMNLVPATIKSQLFPEYEGALLLQESLLGTELRTMTAGFDSDDDDDERVADVETGDDKARSRLSISKA